MYLIRIDKNQATGFHLLLVVATDKITAAMQNGTHGPLLVGVGCVTDVSPILYSPQFNLGQFSIAPEILKSTQVSLSLSC